VQNQDYHAEIYEVDEIGIGNQEDGQAMMQDEF
jgi:hypothetical protein